jgi:hypothetical protein
MKILLITFLTLLLTICLLNTQAQENSVPKGIINRLVEIKYSTELYLTIYSKNNNTKDSALAIYNLIRWQVDGFVMQVSAEMIAANSPRKLMLLNKWCLANTSLLTAASNPKNTIQFYATQLAQIDKSFQGFIFPNNINTRNLNLTTNVFYLIKDSWSVVKGLEDMKSQKTMALVELLNQTRLISPLEILKQTK